MEPFFLFNSNWSTLFSGLSVGQNIFMIREQCWCAKGGHTVYLIRNVFNVKTIIYVNWDRMWTVTKSTDLQKKFLNILWWLQYYCKVLQNDTLDGYQRRSQREELLDEAKTLFEPGITKKKVKLFSISAVSLEFPRVAMNSHELPRVVTISQD